jgi:hypothetical protein
MCSAKLYRHRQFEMNPGEKASITLEVLGEWTLQPIDPSKPSRGSKATFPAGTYVLRFTPRSKTSLKSITIDPDPGGGKP